MRPSPAKSARAKRLEERGRTVAHGRRRVPQPRPTTEWTQTIDVPRAELLDSEDAVLRDFARSLDEHWFIRDLRRAGPGDGMPIGPFGPKTPLAHAGQEFIFAYASRTRRERFRTWLTGR